MCGSTINSALTYNMSQQKITFIQHLITFKRISIRSAWHASALALRRVRARARARARSVAKCMSSSSRQELVSQSSSWASSHVTRSTSSRWWLKVWLEFALALRLLPSIGHRWRTRQHCQTTTSITSRRWIWGGMRRAMMILRCTSSRRQGVNLHLLHARFLHPRAWMRDGHAGMSWCLRCSRGVVLLEWSTDFAFWNVWAWRSCWDAFRSLVALRPSLKQPLMTIQSPSR